MKYRILAILLVAFSLGLGSCSKSISKMRQKVALQGIEDVRVVSLSSVQIDFRIQNETAYNLHLKDAVAHLYYRDEVIGTMTLRDRVEVPRKTKSEVFSTMWNVDLGNPLKLLPILGKVRSGDLSELWVNLELEGRGGPVPVNLSRQKMPLSDFLRTFGVDVTNFTNLLK
ncbi:MAG: hypothetical protein Q4A18_02235 [Rikenellaceae bacterium]|nr:hypothetical protein [Rikenellaceae bacterium]